MRILPLFAFALAAASVALAAPHPAARIHATRVALDQADPARTQAGALRYLGGWVLTSNDKRFGGISSIVARQGRFLALSDEGTLLRFRMDGRGRVSEVRIAPLPAGPGTVASKANRDTESMQLDPATGRIWIGYERANELWRYAADLSRAEAHAAPAAMRDWPANGGAEAIARLADGRFIVFSEEAAGPDGSTAALLFPGDPTDPAAKPIRFGYRAPDGYKVTDAAQLPDGRIVMLNRRFTLLEGVSAIVTIADPAAIVEGKAWQPRELARLASPLTVDNMEALSIEREGGRTILWIASDDNFSGLQRTLLLKFALEGAR
jgi:hypothetical protein